LATDAYGETIVDDAMVMRMYGDQDKKANDDGDVMMIDIFGHVNASLSS
jgi:hypothetical protein